MPKYSRFLPRERSLALRLRGSLRREKQQIPAKDRQGACVNPQAAGTMFLPVSQEYLNKGVTMSLKNWIISTCVVVFTSSAVPLLAEQGAVLRTITVIGEADVSAPPDKAVITLGARHSAASAADALAKTSEAVEAILLRMKALGIDSKDMQTASLNLNPLWRERSRDDDGATLPPVGFEAYNTVSVTLRDLGMLGDVLDQVTREGANSFSGFQFGLIDPGPVQDAARKGAVSEARRKAELYAAAAGVSLGEVVLITEELNGGGGGFPSPMMEMSSVRSSPVPIAQGEVSQRASVKVIFAIAE